MHLGGYSGYSEGCLLLQLGGGNNMKKHLERGAKRLKTAEGFNKFPDAELWFYEEGNGMDIYFYAGGHNGLLTKIPLATIRAYLRRLDK